MVWHTQGSGKSMEMELYANQVLTHPSLGNPTIVVLTDRTDLDDLDDQLYDTFAVGELLPEKPLQVATRRVRAAPAGRAAVRHDDRVHRDAAKIRSTIKRLLARHGYPPDARAGATELVLRQIETFAEE